MMIFWSTLISLAWHAFARLFSPAVHLVWQEDLIAKPPVESHQVGVSAHLVAQPEKYPVSVSGGTDVGDGGCDVAFQSCQRRREALWDNQRGNSGRGSRCSPPPPPSPPSTSPPSPTPSTPTHPTSPSRPSSSPGQWSREQNITEKSKTDLELVLDFKSKYVKGLSRASSSAMRGDFVIKLGWNNGFVFSLTTQCSSYHQTKSILSLHWTT